MRKLITDLASMGMQEILFSGSGEPLLHPNMSDFLALAQSKGVKTSLVTNGLLITEPLVHELTRLGVKDIGISVWAGSEKIYRDLHPSAPADALERISIAIRALREAKDAAAQARPLVTVRNIISTLNWSDIPNMLTFARDAVADTPDTP